MQVQEILDQAYESTVKIQKGETRDDNISGVFTNLDGLPISFWINANRDFVKYQLNFDAKPTKTKPGHHWVNDKRVEGGGYWRKNRGAKNLSSLPKKSSYGNKSIRELQAIASERGVYRSHGMNKQQLVEQLKILDKDPGSQEKIRKTLEKRRQRKQEVEKLLPKNAKEVWQQLRKVTGTSNLSNELAALAVTGVLINAGKKQVNQVKANYRKGFNDSANLAIARAEKSPAPQIKENAVMFTVGGFKGIGSDGKQMKELLDSPLDGSRAEKWLGNNHHIVAFNHPDFDVTAPGVNRRNKDGSYNPAWTGAVLKNGFGKFMQNVQRGRNEASVKLASQIYAYAEKNPNTQINILGHGVGGNVAREATEIVARMRKRTQKSPSGREIINRVNMVNLGTPDFGVAGTSSTKMIGEATISSANDPFNFLPKKNASSVSTVPGHEVRDYLQDPEVREKIREGFGYYQEKGISERQRQLRLKERSAASWNRLGVLNQKYTENPNPNKYSRDAGAIAMGMSPVKYSALVNEYRNSLDDSADQATLLAVEESRNLQKTAKNTTFVVGGAGSPASALTQELGGKLKKTHIHEFDDEYASNIKLRGKPDIAGSYNVNLLNSGYSAALRKNLSPSRPGEDVTPSNDAVALAAKLYAHSRKMQAEYGNDYQLNILAAGTGGITTRSALEILGKMEEGRTFAEKVNSATLGTPDFGLHNNDPAAGFVPQERNFRGDKDPMSTRTPNRHKMSQEVNVTSSDGLSYLKNGKVLKEIKELFGI